MNTKRTLYLLTVTTVTALAAAPGSAEMARLGSVYLPQARGQEKPLASVVNFGGGVDRLGFRAENGPVVCDRIQARFSDGTTYEVYQGFLAPGRETDVMVPEMGSIRDLAIQCRGDGFAAASIDILADPGTHMQEWRSNPDWNSKWWFRFPPAAASAPAQQVSQAGMPRRREPR